MLAASPDRLNESTVLVASASNYGGVATHLNHFFPALSSLTSLKKIFLFSSTSISISPTLKVSLTIIKIAISNFPLYRFFPATFHLIVDVAFSLINRSELSADKLVISSHNPISFFGVGLLSRSIDYYIFVLPVIAQSGTLRPSLICARIDMFVLQLYIKVFLKRKKLRFFVQTEVGALMWEKFLGVEANCINVLPNPPFIINESHSLIYDNQCGNTDINFIVKKVNNGKRLVLSIGHLADYKNPLVWAHIAMKAVEINPSYIFVWVGDGPMYEQLYDMIGHNKNIFLLGRLNQRDIKQLYKCAWIFFHPALEESQGIVIFDALALGVPVFLNNTKILESLLGCTGAGYTFNLSSPDSYNRFIEELKNMEDPKVRKEFSNAAIKSFSGHRLYADWLKQLAYYYRLDF